MNEKEMSIKKYAELAVKTGINLKQNEGLIISTNIYGLPLAREVFKLAYKIGAKHVEIMFSDEDMILSRYENAAEYVFENVPEWKMKALLEMYETNYHHLFITAPNPELLKDVPGELVAKDQKALSEASAPAMQHRMTGRTKWCIVAVPSPAWAKSVYPDLDEVPAMEKLWEKICDATRVCEDDPVKAWEIHDSNLKKYKNYLNEKQFEKLHFVAPGTDLEVYLANNHYWMGGSKVAHSGDPFVANIPTEEVFTTPHKLKVNGTLKATKPLSVNGKIVDGFGFTFKDGKVVDYFADKGKEVLDHLLSNDAGASYLGEVALVPHDSPISNTKILFNNTLFDENASVHFALGRAYPYAMQDGSDLSAEELLERGANYSLVHTDFMVGSENMNIVAFEKNGTSFKIFENGNWCF